MAFPNAPGSLSADKIDPMLAHVLTEGNIIDKTLSSDATARHAGLK
jgi:hypothetical protein